MDWSVAETLAYMAPELPAALVTPAARRRVLSVASALPATLTRWAYLECRLAAHEPQTDLIVRIHPVAGELSAETTRLLGGVRLNDELVDGYWLELDIPPVGASAECVLSHPGVFADLRPAIYTRADATERLQATLSIADMITPGGMPRGVASTISRCVRALPSAARVIYVGGFPHRAGNAMRRLCIAGLDDRELVAYLSRVGWPGSSTELMALLQPFRAPAVRSGSTATIVHLDVGTDVGPVLSLELGLSRAVQRQGGVAALSLLGALVAAGLCAPAKHDALLEWPRQSVGVMPHELWPSLITRRVNHVKVTVRAGVPATAKAYLAASYRVLDRSRIDVSIE